MSIAKAIVSAIVAAAAFSVGAEPQQVPHPTGTAYSAPTWEVAVNTVPCDAFKKQADGSWRQTGTIVVDGNRNNNSFDNNTIIGAGGLSFGGNFSAEFSYNTFKGTQETRILDQRCGK